MTRSTISQVGADDRHQLHRERLVGEVVDGLLRLEVGVVGRDRLALRRRGGARGAGVAGERHAAILSQRPRRSPAGRRAGDARPNDRRGGGRARGARSRLTDVSSVGTRVFVARLAGTNVFDPLGDQVGRVRDVVVLVRPKGAPRAVGLVVEVAARRRVFLPLTRVTVDRLRAGHLDRPGEHAPVRAARVRDPRGRRAAGPHGRVRRRLRRRRPSRTSRSSCSATATG